MRLNTLDAPGMVRLLVKEFDSDDLYSDNGSLPPCVAYMLPWWQPFNQNEFNLVKNNTWPRLTLDMLLGEFRVPSLSSNLWILEARVIPKLDNMLFLRPVGRDPFRSIVIAVASGCFSRNGRALMLRRAVQSGGHLAMLQAQVPKSPFEEFMQNVEYPMLRDLPLSAIPGITFVRDHLRDWVLQLETAGADFLEYGALEHEVLVSQSRPMLFYRHVVGPKPWMQKFEVSVIDKRLRERVGFFPSFDSGIDPSSKPTMPGTRID